MDELKIQSPFARKALGKKLAQYLEKKGIGMGISFDDVQGSSKEDGTYDLKIVGHISLTQAQFLKLLGL